MSGRTIARCGSDPFGDRWAIALWSATAALFFCRYFYEEEGAHDSSGRWRRQRVGHYLAGCPADQARAAAMATHFCSVARESARGWQRASGRTAHARSSFESAFAERLVVRLRVALGSARSTWDARLRHRAADEANDVLLREAGVASPSRPGPQDKFGRDRAAVRQGRAAADNISLILRSGPKPGTQGKATAGQMQLPF